MAVDQKTLASLLRRAMTDLGVGALEIQRRTAEDGQGKPINETTIGRYRDPAWKRDRPIRPQMKRRIEKALETFRGYLDNEWPDVPPSEQRRLLRARQAPPGGSWDRPTAEPVRVAERGMVCDVAAGSGGRFGHSLAFIRHQLAGYRETGRMVPVSVVVSWLVDLEEAASATAQSPESAPPASESAG